MSRTHLSQCHFDRLILRCLGRTVWWGGWWVGLAFAKIAPGLLHHTVGAVLPFLDPWIGHLGNMQLSMTAFIWSLLSWSKSALMTNYRLLR